MRPERFAAVLIALSSTIGMAQAPRQISGGQRQFSMPQIRSQCIEFTDVKRGNGPLDFRDCQVSDFGEFGAVDDQTYYYALYCLIPNYATDNGKCGDDSFSARFHRHRGLAVFTEDRSSGGLQLLFERVISDIGTRYYEKPEIVHNTNGTLLYLPIAVDGTGHGNESQYYIREANKWEPIESEVWLNDLSARLPPGLQMWKGAWPNLNTMQAQIVLYRDKDANCCGTGGTARVRLAIRSRKFVIDSVDIEPRQ